MHCIQLHSKRHLKPECSLCLLEQFSEMLEKNGIPQVVAGLGVLVAALIALDTFNNTFLAEGTLNNPVNALAFAAAGKGFFSTATFRIVRSPASSLLVLRQQFPFLRLTVMLENI